MKDTRLGMARLLPLSLAPIAIKSGRSSEKEIADTSELPMSSNWTMFLENTSILKMEYKDNAENGRRSCGEVLVVAVGDQIRQRPLLPVAAVNFRVKTLFGGVRQEHKSLFLLLMSSLLEM